MRLHRGRWLALVLLIMLVACAQPARIVPAPGEIRTQWVGRLALRIESEPAQAFFAAFELRGNAQAGELSLFSPIGSTLGKMQWMPGLARLYWNGEERDFNSLDALTREATGSELPVASLFRWLVGEQATGDGWVADLQYQPEGKIVARRPAPSPAVELRLVFE